MKLKYGAFILALLGAVILLQKPSVRSGTAPAVSLSQKSQGPQNAGIKSVVAADEKVKSLPAADTVAVESHQAGAVPTSAQAQKPATPSQEQVTDWAIDLGKSMLEATHNPEHSFKMFDKLQKCVEDAGQAEVYRAICAANLKRLSEKFPDRFAQKYSSAQLSFDEKIRTFLAQANTNF